MWIVYNFCTNDLYFIGTIDQCLAFIDQLPGQWENPVDMKPQKNYVKSTIHLLK